MDEKKRRACDTPTESLLELGKDELVHRVKQLEAHVKQLQNVLSRSTVPPSRKEKPFDFSR